MKVSIRSLSIAVAGATIAAIAPLTAGCAGDKASAGSGHAAVYG